MSRETGIEAHTLTRDGKKLRYGFTTGSCAAAAAKAAAILLLSGKAPETVQILTPKGIQLTLEVLEARLENGKASCAIRKDSGDDPDVTNGVLVYAEVSYRSAPGVEIDGGIGVGRITKPGLKRPIGAAAINPVPLAMIREAVAEPFDDCAQPLGLDVVISIPAGVELAKRTFNPNLGIVGGISVLGTSGIVEPMSDEALVKSIELEIRQKRILGAERLILTPGNYGADFLRTLCRIDEKSIVKCSNFIGRTLDLAIQAGFREVLLIGHIGKLIKLAAGMMNTHSNEGDGRAEIMACCALRAGLSAETALEISECVTTDAMIDVLRRENGLEKTMKIAAERIDFYLRKRVKGELTIGAVVFSNETGILCQTGPSQRWIEELQGGKP